jgi:Ca-activated chloride channel family protein
MFDVFEHIELTHPHWLWLLPALFIASRLLHAYGKAAPAASLASGGTHLQQPLVHPLLSLFPKSQSVARTSALQKILLGLTLGFFVFSLSEPVRIGEKLPDPPRERDIVFIVDTSISMTLRDYMLDNKRIDRMTLLKGVLDRFIQQLPGERIGIIIFGDAAYTLVPLTRDQSLLRRMLSRIQATMAGRFNNIGEAIALAVKQAQQQKQGKRHRVLVMLTDADKPTGSITPDTAAQLAKSAGLPLYTIAIGASTGAAEEQRTTGLIYEPVDTALLSAISRQTGARSYQAGDVQALEQAINDINQHETNLREIKPRYQREPLYLWPLMFGLGTLTLLTTLPALMAALRRKNMLSEKIAQ